ncbi:MAG: class I SAM-dependent methyltransferase [Burkholderiales bacterium]
MNPAISRRVSSALSRVSPQIRQSVEIVRHAREHAIPNPPECKDEYPNMPMTRLDTPGIDFREAEQLEKLRSWRSPERQTLFRALREDATINRHGFGSEAVSNTFCNTPDAEIYASMIVDRKPRRIVEVGSGFSTIIAKKAIDHSALETRIVVIDPFPRTDVRSVADDLTLLRVEQTDLIGSDWSAQDLLFIDSSHICKTRGDLPYLFCQLLPSLPSGVLIHIHDIFLPYDYPNLYDNWWHTEEYLLACTLAHSTRYKVVMATHWLSRMHGTEMEKTFGPFSGTQASSPHHFGCSFWIEVQ